jgi:hypothetical protein
MKEQANRPEIERTKGKNDNKKQINPKYLRFRVKKTKNGASAKGN